MASEQLVICELILVRHGVTEYNVLKKMQGHVDTSLTLEGHEQARMAASFLRSMNPQAIYSSDLRRAYDTAVPIARESNISLICDSRLRETDLGQWSGLGHREVDEKWPSAREHWRANPYFSPPGGESKVQVAQRGRDFIAHIESKHVNTVTAPIIIVSHSGFISALTASLLGLAPEQWNMFDGLSNTSWVRLRKYNTGRWALGAWNAAATQSTVTPLSVDHQPDTAIQ